MLHPETRKVGRYEILEVIGVGANSRVARAFEEYAHHARVPVSFAAPGGCWPVDLVLAKE